MAIEKLFRERNNAMLIKMATTPRNSVDGFRFRFKPKKIETDLKDPYFEKTINQTIVYYGKRTQQT